LTHAIWCLQIVRKVFSNVVSDQSLLMIDSAVIISHSFLALTVANGYMWNIFQNNVVV